MESNIVELKRKIRITIGDHGIRLPSGIGLLPIIRRAKRKTKGKRKIRARILRWLLNLPFKKRIEDLIEN